MDASFESVAYLVFTVSLVGVLFGMAWHLYKGPGRETSEKAKFDMMDDD